MRGRSPLNYFESKTDGFFITSHFIKAGVFFTEKNIKKA